MATPLCESCGERPGTVRLDAVRDDDGSVLNRDAFICRDCHEQYLGPVEPLGGQESPGPTGEGDGKPPSAAEDALPRVQAAVATPPCADCGKFAAVTYHSDYGTPMCPRCQMWLQANEEVLAAERARLRALGFRAIVGRGYAGSGTPSRLADEGCAGPGASAPPAAERAPAPGRGGRRLGGKLGPDFPERLGGEYRRWMEQWGHRPRRVEMAAEFGVSVSTFDRALKTHDISWPPPVGDAS